MNVREVRFVRGVWIFSVLLLVACMFGARPAQASFPWSDRPAAPDSASVCTPLLTPITCIVINGSGLHVNYFRVDVYFDRGSGVDVGDPIQGYARIRNGKNGPLVYQRFVTLSAPSGWTSFQFTANKTYANPWTACAQFVDTVPGGVFSTYQPCADIHALAGQGARAGAAVFEIQDLTATVTDRGVVIEATVENLTDSTWRLALSAEIGDAEVDYLPPKAQHGFLSPHEISTVQLNYKPGVFGHHTVIVGAWGKDESNSWSEWAGASTGFVWGGGVPEGPAGIDSTTNCTPYFSPNVCISIVGSGLHVDSVSVGVRWPEGYDYYGLYKVLKNNVTWKVSPIFGGTGTGQYRWWTWTINANLPNGTVLCGQHTDPLYVGKKPCATIHS